jgi:hypothetical protein
MITSWRLLVAAALTALTMTTLTAATAAAQTVMVRHAPPGETVETVLNATKVGTATVDASGTASVPLSLSSTGKTEIDANIFVDICDKLHRVIVVERNKLPDPQQPGCARRDISGLYWVRPVNTLVVDVAEGRPSLLLVKGSYNPERPRTWNTAPRGFVVYGGGTIGSFRDAISVSCGNVTDCKGDSTLAGFTAGGTVWLLPYLGADVAYVKPQDVKTSGSGSTYHFNSDLESQLLTIAGKVGAPIGPVRLYGQAGMAYHWTKNTGTETIDDLTITVDNVQQTIPGGTQASLLETEGWGWLFGGGGEVWIARSIALYADLNFASITGSAKSGGEARIDDTLRFIAFGARVHIGHR